MMTFFSSNSVNKLKFEAQNLNHATSLPAEVYVKGEFENFDKQAVLKNSWQLAAHVSQLQKQGDHVVHEIAGTPVIVVNTGENDNKQSIQAFYNVCRHRGGPLALKNGNSKTLMCKYHGWNYHLNGQLKSAPEMQQNKNFNVCDHKLPEIKTAIWQGFVFVALKEDNDLPDLDEVFEGISEHIAPIDMSQMVFCRRDEFIIECNWKVYVENYLEGYHLPHVHPGLNKLLDYKSYQTELKKWHSYQFSPIDTGTTSEDNPYGDGQAHYYFAYPNTMFNILPNRVQSNQVLPINSQQCRVVFDYYYPKLPGDALNKLIAEDRDFSDEVQDEDISICEAVQKGYASGSYTPGPLCAKRESGLHHFQELIRTAYRSSEKKS